VEQQEIGDTDAVTRIYLNLTRMFEDPEDGDDITFTAAVGNAPWLSLLPVYNEDLGGMRTGPQRWGDIRFGLDGASGGTGRDADITWGQGSGVTLTAPADVDDIVLILSVDRDTRDGTGSIAQDANGAITITATDDDNNASETTFEVEIGDENLPVSAQAAAANRVVTLSGPPREVNDLTATFNKLLDPDFTGAEADEKNPILVRYQWFTFARADSNNDGVLDDDDDPTHSVTPTPKQETTENYVEATGRATYTVQQSDVGGLIEGRVIYYELFDGEIVQSPDTGDADGVQGYASAPTWEIQNVPDEERMSFTVDTTSTTADNTTTHFLRITPSFLPGQDRDRPVNTDEEIEIVSNTVPSGYDFDYAWEYSPNGTTDWTVIRDLDNAAVDDDPNAANPTPKSLVLPKSVESGYVRLVVIYRDEGDPQGNQVENRVNRIESEAVKVGKDGIMHVGSLSIVDASTGEAPAPTGNIIPAGWTLRIDGLTDVRGGSSKVEWLLNGRVPVGEDSREYTVSESDRGTISARVTRYDEDGGLVSRTTVSPNNEDGAVRLTPNADPIAAQAGAHFVNLGKAPDANGEYAMLTGEIKLQSLFTDPEGDSLRFDVLAPPAAGGFSQTDAIPDNIPGNPLDLWLDLGTQGVEGNTGGDSNGVANRGAEGDQILLVNERTGEVEYHSTEEQDHGRADSADNDGDGNWIPVTVNGTDNLFGPFSADATATVNLRIDAAPTGFQRSQDFLNTGDPLPAADNNANTRTDPDGTASVTATPPGSRLPFDYGATVGGQVTYAPYTVREHEGDEVVTAGDQGLAARGLPNETARVIARIDVQDDNSPMHAYGQYTFTVSDDRFEVVAVPASIGGDASQGILRLKTGENLDFEALEPAARTLNDDGTSYVIANNQQRSIDLVVTATPVDPDGSDPHDPITLGVRVNVINVAETTDPDANDVPGLEDIEPVTSGTGTGDDGGDPDPDGGDDTDTTDDTDAADDDDGDHDGGWWSASDDGLF